MLSHHVARLMATYLDPDPHAELAQPVGLMHAGDAGTDDNDLRRLALVPLLGHTRCPVRLPARRWPGGSRRRGYRLRSVASCRDSPAASRRHSPDGTARAAAIPARRAG